MLKLNNNNNKQSKSSRRRRNRKKNRNNNNEGVVKAPTAQSKVMRQSKAKIDTSGNSYRIRKSELIGTVTDAASFTVTKYPLNPGMPETFPWLSIIAADWEEYRFHMLRFEYVTRTATTTVGSIVMAPDYDALDTAPTTEALITSYEDAVEDAYWKDINCYLNPSSMFPMGNRKFIRNSAVAGDLKTYDAGNLFLSVDGATTSAIGKLWVHYEVSFYTPQISPSAPLSTKMAQFNLSANQGLADGVAEVIAYDEEICNPLGITNASGTFTLPKGFYMIFAETAFNDSVGGVLSTGTTEIAYDAVALTPPNIGKCGINSTGNIKYNTTNVGCVTSLGGTVVIDAVIDSSSGGTLQLVADRCRISFLLV